MTSNMDKGFYFALIFKARRLPLAIMFLLDFLF